MEYQPIPAGFISVESGQSSGPPLRVDAHRVTGRDAMETDSSCDSILVTLQDDEILAAIQLKYRMGEPVTHPHVRYALNIGDARRLAVELLFNLSHCGDMYARKILERLEEISDEVRGETS